MSVYGLPRWLCCKNKQTNKQTKTAWQCRRCGFNPRVGKTTWRRKWQPTPIVLSGKSHGQRNLPGYSPWGCKELNKTEHTCTSICDCLKNVHFSLTMSNLKRKFRRQLHLQWHKQIKVLRNKLNKGGRDLYIKNYRTLNFFKRCQWV